MRILGQPDREHVPRDDVERRLCAALRQRTGHEIAALRTREECSGLLCDENGTPVESGYDYVVDTSQRYEDWYCEGLRFGVNVAESSFHIDELGCWSK